MVCLRGRREGFTGRESRWIFMTRIRESHAFAFISLVGPVSERMGRRVRGHRSWSCASLEYQNTRIQGIFSNIDSAECGNSCRKVISGCRSMFWMCEMSVKIRASGANAAASTFHITRTNLEPLGTLSSSTESVLVLVYLTQSQKSSFDGQWIVSMRCLGGKEVGAASVSWGPLERHATILVFCFGVEWRSSLFFSEQEIDNSVFS